MEKLTRAAFWKDNHDHNLDDDDDDDDNEKIAMKNMMTKSKIEDDDQTGPDLRWTLVLALFLHRSLPIAAIVVNIIVEHMFFFIRIMIILPPTELFELLIMMRMKMMRPGPK